MSEPREVACLCKHSRCEQLTVDGCQVIFDAKASSKLSCLSLLPWKVPMHLRNLEVFKPLEVRTSESRNLEREASQLQAAELSVECAGGREIASQARHSDRAEHVVTRGM